MAFLTPGDLSDFTETPISESKALLMIEDATAMAVLAAPCLSDESTLTAVQQSQVRAILRGAILRWHEAGSGAMQSENIGPYGYTIDNRQQRKGMFWPSELQQLQSLCSTGEVGAFSVDTIGADLTIHSETCALRFGASYCSCGADIAGFPIYG